MINFKLVNITPEYATELLTTNSKNRRLSKSLIARLAKDIKQGNWKLTGDAIKISSAGKLIDGQHRLSAIVAAGLSAQSMIADNVDDDAFQVIDTGKRRSHADVLVIGGHINATALAAALKLQYAVDECGQPKMEEKVINLSRNVTNSDIMAIYEQYPDMGIVSMQIKDLPYTKRLLTAAVASVCLYSFNRIDPALAKWFFEKLEHGADLSSGSPLLYLRNRLADIRNTPGVKRTSAFFALTAAFMAWNYIIDGKMPKKQWLIQERSLPTLLKPIK